MFVDGRCLLLAVDVLVPDDLVGDPVEDVEDEECQRKGRPGDSVYPLGSVHKLLLHGVYVFGDWWLRVRNWSSVLDSWAVLRWQTLAHVVASKIKAAFTHVIILENEHAHVDRVNVLSLFNRPQPRVVVAQWTNTSINRDIRNTNLRLSQDNLVPFNDKTCRTTVFGRSLKVQCVEFQAVRLKTATPHFTCLLWCLKGKGTGGPSGWGPTPFVDKKANSTKDDFKQ